MIVAEQGLRDAGYWIVVAGLIGEIGTLVITRHVWEKALSALFTIVIIVGLVVEHNADNRISDLISQQESKSNERVAELEKEARQAELELKRLKTPRVFQASAVFTNEGNQYLAGTKFDLAANPDFESMTLAIEVRQALTDIGMIEQPSNTRDNWTPPGGGIPIGTIMRPGVGVRACGNPLQAPKDKPTKARILGALLADSGLGTKEMPVFLEPWDAADCAAPDVLHVEIGDKPTSPWKRPDKAQVIYPSFDLPVRGKK